MTVARILAEKGRRVFTTRPERSMQDVALELTRHAVGALVVLDANDEIVGIVSERDIVSAIANHGPSILTDPVAHYMTRNPKVASEDDTIDTTMETMTVERFRHLPVTHNGRLTGIVSIGDVVKHRIEAIEYEHKALRDYIATA